MVNIVPVRETRKVTPVRATRDMIPAKREKSDVNGTPVKRERSGSQSVEDEGNASPVRASRLPGDFRAVKKS